VWSSRRRDRRWVACATNRRGTKAYRAKTWIGFSEDDAERFAGGAKYQAAKPLSQRVEDNAFHRCAQEIRFQCCYQTLAEYFSTTLPFGITGNAGGDWDSRFGICKSLSGSPLQTSPLQPLNEIFYRFSKPLHFRRFNTLALDGFRPNGARGALPGAARKIRDAAGPVDLPARDLAANDLAVRPIHQLSSERRRARE
jgi:hypothetical protein